MALKYFKPTSSGIRQKIASDFSEIKTGEKVKDRKKLKKSVRSLTVKLQKHSGHNNQGKITSRFRGGGHRKIYRIIDFLRSDKAGIEAKVSFLDYDPNRNCYIALLVYRDGEKRYILAPEGLKAGDIVVSGEEAPIRTGNALPLINIPLGSNVHNIELYPGRGGQIARSAGQSAQLIAKEKGMVALKLASGESRWVSDRCYGTLGVVGKSEDFNQNDSKAGRRRWRGRKPHIRGSAMNPVDHKHGGGEGRCPVGIPTPYTFAGRPHGLKSRKKRKNSNKYIISSRKKRK